MTSYVMWSVPKFYYTLFEGRMPENDTEIVLDHVFSKNRNIKIGDSVSLLDKAYTVCGTVSLPDYSSLFMNNSDLVMNTQRQRFCSFGSEPSRCLKSWIASKQNMGWSNEKYPSIT